MDFIVTPAHGEPQSISGEYTVEPSGVLTVLPTTDRPMIYSAIGWLSLRVMDGESTSQDQGGANAPASAGDPGQAEPGAHAYSPRE